MIFVESLAVEVNEILDKNSKQPVSGDSVSTIITDQLRYMCVHVIYTHIHTHI